MVSLGNGHVKAGEFELAVDAYTKGLEARPTDTRAAVLHSNRRWVTDSPRACRAIHSH